jgi:hypothetical protein
VTGDTIPSPADNRHTPVKKRNLIRRIAAGLVGRAARAIIYGLVGGFCVAIVGGVLYLNNRPDLKVWHTVKLDVEFTAGSQVTSFEEYLALEDRLFTQLDEQVYPMSPADFTRSRMLRLTDCVKMPHDWTIKPNSESTGPVEPAMLENLLGSSPKPL